MTIRNTFRNGRMQKFVAGFVACVFLALTLFLTFPVIDTPLGSETYAAFVHTFFLEICAFGLCITFTWTVYHNHTS